MLKIISGTNTIYNYRRRYNNKIKIDWVEYLFYFVAYSCVIRFIGAVG